MAARKRKRGGKRPGAGRKAISASGEALTSWTGRLDRAQLRELAGMLGVSESEAVRAAIAGHLVAWQLQGSARTGART